jgi:hypothetical protein
MNFDSKILLKAISPKLMTKAVQAFDRSTTIVVGACWAAALLMIGFALYTLHLSVATKLAAESALVAEPNLPQIVHKQIEPREAQVLVDRLQHLYPDISFAFRNNLLAVVATDGSKFRQWLMALGYIDTISPQFHWGIQEFCVGNCGSHDLMKVVLSGEKISFEKPQLDSKN